MAILRRETRAAKRPIVAALMSVLAAVQGGCITTAEKSTELSRVAKDWCLTIRASQVMPVYPLSCDVLPGDVFLTTTPIGEEVRLFESNGFLPLDVHAVRLKAVPSVTAAYRERTADGKAFPGATQAWDDMPSSGFPTYSFDIRRSGGLNLAFPIQGVPVGLNYLRSESATCTVAIVDAQTYGLDIDTLRPLLEKWRTENQDWLASYGKAARSGGVHVRVVTRVYRAKEISVELRDTASSGGAAEAGIALAAPDPQIEDPTKSASERAKAKLDAANAELGREFGANLKIADAKGRSVTLKEKFAVPMTFGYTAFDCLVLPGGVLSAPMPTYYRVTGQSDIDFGSVDNAGLFMAWYTADEARRKPLVNRWITDHMGANPPGFVDFATQDKWTDERWRLLYHYKALSQ